MKYPYLTLYYADSPHLGCGSTGLGAEKSAQQNHGPSKLDLALEEFWSWPASFNAPTFDGILVK